MLLKVYIACVEKDTAQIPGCFRTLLDTVTEEYPVRYRQPHDRLLHQMGLIMAAAPLRLGRRGHLTVARGKYGKPYFREYPRFAFSISHSGKYVACAVSEHSVGLDLQRQTVLERNSWPLFMSPEEAEACSGSNQALLLWSAKEAVSKYTGYGFMRPPPTIGVLRCRNPNTVYAGGEKLFLWQQRYRQQYVLSVCTWTGQPPQIEEFSEAYFRSCYGRTRNE